MEAQSCRQIYLTNATLTNVGYTPRGNSVTNTVGLVESFGGGTLADNNAPAGSDGGAAVQGETHTETIVQSSIIVGNGSSDVDLVENASTNSIVTPGYNRRTP